MKIHSLFILNKAGACLYSRNITSDFENIEPNLITPFFSAIFSFSESVISKETPEILEMGGFRIAFKVEGDYIYAILANTSASLLFIESRLISIVQVFKDFLENNKVESYEVIENPEFDDKIDSIITGDEELVSSQPLYKKIIDLFNRLTLENEILGAALFSINGKVIFSSLPNEILLSSLKELEIRHIVANEYAMTFYSLENDQKVFSRIINIPWKLDPLLIVILYESSVPLGMAEVNLEKITKAIQNII
ncbi:MAG: hypothetical protein HWN80_12075 [Candidatus Lokiarchaeota archaeon]|nr:hypothetical protein [Candidatus Lokiarchaeota archaeon]